jgi:glycine cleavage system H protein
LGAIIIRVSYPDEYRYTTHHQWVNVEGDVASIGLTKHGQEVLGDIVAVDLPKPGTIVAQDQEIGSVDSVKTATELICPVSGTVLEVNHLLDESPEKLNVDPHGDAWLLKIKLSAPSEIAALLTSEAYQKLLDEEEQPT